MTNKQAMVRLKKEYLGEWEENRKAKDLGIIALQQIEDIKEILRGYVNSTDIWKGMDEVYVLSKIEEVVDNLGEE